MKIKVNRSKDGFVDAINEPSPRFFYNGIHMMGDIENLQGNECEKDPSASKDQSQ